MNHGKRISALLLSLAMGLTLAACSPSANMDETPPASDSPAAPGISGSESTLRRDKMTQAEADAVPAQSDLVTISTACGDITGIQKDGYTEWRGIRYATAERFEDPVLVTGWTGIYDAAVWGDRAPQYYGFYNMADSNVNQFYIDESTFQWNASYSEDCLNLNIWAPDNAENCPVLVFIHGGSFISGSNTDISTDGEAFARNGIVTVAINYRLGAFQQVYGDGYTGNLALLDQLAALHWIRDNIADYGGDGSKITIMGESAGAVSVQNLLASPLVEDGLLSGAIMMSGGGDLSALGSPTVPSVIEAEWEKVKQAFEVNSIAELKTVDAKELFITWVRSGATATPTVNGAALDTNITAALDNNTVKNVPVIIGMLSEDMWPYSLYSAATGYAAKRSAAGGAPVYLYYFDRQVDKTFGAFHAADLYYMFGSLYRNFREMDDTDYRISAAMIAYVSNFVKTGDPNGGGLTQWDPATAASRLFMHFGDENDGMIAPDISLLSNNEATRAPFPYANSIKINNTSNSAKTPIDHQEILGEWLITGWITPGQEGSEVTVDYEAVFAFTENERFYYVDGELSNTRSYVWDGDCDMVCSAPGEDDLVCAIYWGEGSCLLIEDPRYGIAYTCYRKDGAPPQSGSSNGKTPISAQDLNGDWDILGWTVNADGSWVGIDPGQSYSFDGSEMIYDAGADQYATAYAFKDAYTLFLADWELEWPLWLNEQGQLCIIDSRYGITYVCEK